MKRIGYKVFALAVLAALAGSTAALASPAPSFTVIQPRIFNDCPSSVLSTVDNDFTMVQIIDDADTPCGGFANLHNWRFSEDDTNPVFFQNGDIFLIKATLVIDGPGQAEAGLHISPWWSPDVDGRFQVRTTDGKVECWGGVLPYYDFTGTHGVVYTKGNEITLEINYVPYGNSDTSPATIEYKLTYLGTTYSSGELPMLNCNAIEEPLYGCYGILNFAEVGGFIQCLWQAGDNEQIGATWTTIEYAPEGKPTPTVPSTWGRVKTLYR